MTKEEIDLERDRLATLPGTPERAAADGRLADFRAKRKSTPAPRQRAVRETTSVADRSPEVRRRFLH
jgi:hypothetical protein